jgi:hypothetical protein
MGEILAEECPEIEVANISDFLFHSIPLTKDEESLCKEDDGLSVSNLWVYLNFLHAHVLLLKV